MSFFGVDKVFKIFTIIRANGGIRSSLYKLYNGGRYITKILVSPRRAGIFACVSGTGTISSLHVVIHVFARNDDLKMGTLIGSDKFGNKYYENNELFYGRNRWVEYPPSVGLEYDGSQVPAEWFGWLHYKTDLPPTVKPPPNYKWIQEHTENLTGTDKQYVPYSTTKPKIEAWTPPKKSGGSKS